MLPSSLPLLLAAGALLAFPARAQHRFQVGPTAGAALSTVHSDALSASATLPLRGGWLAGATGTYQSQGRWGAQLAVLYAQQGYTQHFDGSSGYQVDDQVRLNYLRLPLQATFSQHAAGQGLQVFAGPYVGVLLGGHRAYESSSRSGSYVNDTRVVVADSHAERISYGYDLIVPDYMFYARRFDVGLQGGVGYRWGNALLQVGYTLGLRNLAATTVYTSGPATYSAAGEPYRTRGVQASLTYLLGPKS